MRALATFLLGLAFALGLADVVPEIVIVQTKRPNVDEQNPNVPASSFVAEELDSEGRVFPIVWSWTDPIFRAATEEKLIPNASDNPSLREAQDGARKLKAEFLLMFEAYHEESFIVCKARLYRGSREVWKDERKMGASADGSFAFENTLRTLARTWAQVMGQGPLKDLPPRKREPTPEPEPGEKPPVAIDPKTEPPVPKSNPEVVAEAMKLLASGRVVEAIAMLRNAVDSEPFDVERRRALVTTYMQIREFHLAAGEARRAATLFPEKIELWTLAARAWLAMGNKDEALKDLNEAVARDPESPLTRMLLGEVQLMALRFGFAIEHFDKAIEKTPTGDALFKRGVARFLTGQIERANEDLSESKRLEPDVDPSAAVLRYRFAVEIAQAMATGDGGEIPALIARAKVQHTDPELKAMIEGFAARIGGAAALARAMAAPETHRDSHDRLVLALNLLSQSLSDARAHLASPSEDILAEATLNLGEALRHLRASKEAYAGELGKS